MASIRKIGLAFLLALFGLGFALVAPDSAFAAEEESTSSGMALLIPNMTEFIPMIIAFIIMWIIFAKLVYPVIMGMIDKRAQTIKDNLQQAEDSKIESARMLSECEELLEQAKTDASKIVADARASAEVAKTRILEEAHAEAASIIERANEAVEANKRAAISDIQSSVADISVSVAGKLIGQDLSDEEHRKIIARYVSEAGSLNAG